MDVFFLGAGESFTGTLPAALKAISKNKKALDWQLQSLERADVANINFIGGFHVQEVIEQYPQLSYTIAPDWRNSNVIHSLQLSPFRPNHDALMLYSDTLFRPKVIEKFSQLKADVAIGVDSHWLTRFEQRSDSDISTSEVLNLADFGEAEDQQVEFTGMIKFSRHVIDHVKRINPESTTNLIELIQVLYQADFNLEFFDVKGDWTEFNSDLDVAHFILGTKSETLYRLFPLVKKSQIGEQVTFTVKQWRDDSDRFIEKIRQRFNHQPLVIRSSSFAEDCWDESHAGGFESVLNVDSKSSEDIIAAVNEVITSYQNSNSLEYDQVLVQECLSKVKMSGVVFTRSLETGAPYYRINFDDQTQSTESVTSGTGSQLRTVIVSKEHSDHVSHLSSDLMSLLSGVNEIEDLLGYDKLDIEFAIDANNQLHVFQVRPIAVNHQQNNQEDQQIKAALDHCVDTFHQEQIKGPGQVGDKAYFGVMPDWNPAEIIGVKPKPLAYSLYRHLIVDQVWAIQRAEFGYRDNSRFPLIRTFVGQPYVNIRNSLNSFIPASVSEQAAERICNAYLAILSDQPQLHDKIEFDVAFTVLSPQFDDEVNARLKHRGVLDSDISELRSGLLTITQNAFSRLANDISSLEKLEMGRSQIINSELTEINQALLLLDDCKKHGTLAFSHAARAGFVAMTFLNGLVKMNVINQAEKDQFLSSFNTVAGEFEQDAQAVSEGKLSDIDYVETYGHLRPGTYDITAKAYWENPEQYLFSKSAKSVDAQHEVQEFTWSADKQKQINALMKDLGFELNALELLNYCRKATQAREYVKFQFSKNLSKAIDLIVKFGVKNGFKRKQLAFLNLSDLREYSLGVQGKEGLKKTIKLKKKAYALTEMIELPQLILKEADFYAFERNASEPNYVTSKAIEAECVSSVDDPTQIEGKIVFIEQADPGYDWMFAYGLAGLITQYGGANSHMAIRSAELNLPAAIGVGDKIYDEFKDATIIRLNCGLKQIIRIK